MISTTTNAIVLLAALVASRLLQAEEPQRFDFVQFGKMHEVVGKKQHEGRVALAELVKQPHFYGVGALESLAGEATIFDGKVTATAVNNKGKLASKPVSSETKAALLVGGYVPAWRSEKVPNTLTSDELDSFLEQAALRADLDTQHPLIFVIEGKFRNVHLHVINGACPIRARMRKEALSPDELPFEGEYAKVSGKLVGVFARDSVGNVTHPATATHMHLLFQGGETEETRTGHVERVTVEKGAVLRLPK